MSLIVTSRIGRRRTFVIPKAVAEKLQINEGCKVKITVEEGRIVMEPVYDAVWLSLHCRKIVKVTLEDLERESIEQQKKYIGFN
ncbi:MAG: AbrB/MazE/SpoVT family DNA-binding domain-containing protein [Candidatus Bathyarchaeia archaeon]